jgi:hypothetical protein
MTCSIVILLGSVGKPYSCDQVEDDIETGRLEEKAAAIGVWELTNS